MADLFCQNKECCYKKNQGQIRGSAGNKHYQSNKVSKWLEYWCTTGCRDEWFKTHKHAVINAIGIIPTAVIQVVALSLNHWSRQPLVHQYFMYGVALLD